MRGNVVVAVASVAHYRGSGVFFCFTGGHAH